MNVPRPFRCEIPAARIADLHERIDRARWPDQINDEAWSYGTELNYLRELVEYWRTDFRWSQAQAEINAFDHWFTNSIVSSLRLYKETLGHSGATKPLV